MVGRPTIALHVTATGVYGGLVHQGRVTGERSTPATPTVPVLSAVSATLLALRTLQPSSQRVAIALGPSLMRCRFLTPSQAERFGISPRTTVSLDPREMFADMADAAVRMIAKVRADGSALVAAIGEPLLRDLEAAVAGQGLRMVAAVPVAQAIATGQGLQATIVDGQAVWSVTARDGRVTGITFQRGVPAGEPHPPLDLALVQAACQSGEVIFKRPRNDRPSGRLLARSVALVGIGTLLLAPPAASSYRAASLRRALDQSEAATREAEREQHQQLVDEQREARLRSFENGARLQARLPLLARIAFDIPREIFVTQVAAESSDVEMTVVGEDVARLPQSLQSQVGISNARVVGAVTRDVVNERAMQRATLRFEIGAARQTATEPGASK